MSMAPVIDGESLGNSEYLTDPPSTKVHSKIGLTSRYSYLSLKQFMHQSGVCKKGTTKKQMKIAMSLGIDIHFFCSLYRSSASLL